MGYNYGNMKKIFLYGAILLFASAFFLLPNSSSAELSTRTLKFGDISPDVRELQIALNSIGKNITNKGEETNRFGEKTRAAIQSLQCEHSIVCAGDPSHGIFGPLTRNLLISLQRTLNPHVLGATTDGLIAHYAFDGSTSDSAGSNNGTASGGPTYAAGKIGQALQFDGSDDAVTIPDSPGVGPTGPMTMSAWFKTSTVPGGSTKNLISKVYAYSLGLAGSGATSISMGIRGGLSSDGYMLTVAPFNDNNWHLLTATFDGLNVNLYLDGATVGSRATTRRSIDDSIHPLQIGGGAGSFFSGAIDDVRIYNRALQPAEISEIFTSAGGGGGGTLTTGQCSAVTVNSCTVGIFSDLADSATHNLWSCTGTNNIPTSCSLPKSDTATTFTLTTTKTGTGSGTLTSAPAGINCGTDCSETLNSGTAITLTATPAIGSTFGGWSNGCTGTSPTCAVTMNASKTVTATFSTGTPPPSDLNAIRTPAPAPVSWTAPIGIPTPSFGIFESHFMYQLPVGSTCTDASVKGCFNFTDGRGVTIYPDGGAGPYTHYVDNSLPQCTAGQTTGCATDTANPFGTHLKPRKGMPTLSILPAGSVVEIHGGPYESFATHVSSQTGTADKPIFFRGPNATNKAEFKDRVFMVRGPYIIVEHVLFNNNAADIRPWTATENVHHVAIRHSEAMGVNNGIGTASNYADTRSTHDIVFYNNYVHLSDVDRMKAATVPFEQDNAGVYLGINSSNVWVIDNDLSGMGGDAVGGGHGVNYTARNYYIGRNKMHNTGENAIDLKEVENIVVSENKMYDFDGPSAGSGGSGAAIVVHYGPRYSPKNTWFISNDISDANGVGLGVGGDQEHDVFFLNNTIHNIKNPARNAWAYKTWSSRNVYLANNTFYDNDNHVYSQVSSIGSNLAMANNIFSTVTNGGFHLALGGSSATNAQNSPNIANNIFYQGASTPVKITRAGVNMNTLVTTGPNLSVAQFKTSANTCVGCLEVNPGYVNESGNDVRLAAGSPAIDAGSATLMDTLASRFQTSFGLDVRKDFLGMARTQGSAIDIGAYEYTGSTPPPTTRTLTLTTSGSGSVTGTGINCGTDCSETLPTNTSVTLTATPASGSTFTGWGGGCTGTSPTCTVMLSSNINVTATFGGGTPDTIAPTISITSPSGVISGTVTLSATAADNVGVLGVQFKLNGANIGSEDTSAPYEGLWNTAGITNGVHTLTAIARDAAGNQTTSSLVIVTITNSTNNAPVANAGSDQTIPLTSTITLSGSASSDPDLDTLTYTWTKVSGPNSFTLTNPTSVSPTASFTTKGTYTFRLTVSDGSLTSSDTVTITVNDATAIIEDRDNDGVEDALDRCPNTPAHLKEKVNRRGCVKPRLLSFDIKPDLEQDIDALDNAEIGKAGIGRVLFKERVSFAREAEELNIEDNLKIEKNKIILNALNLPELNKRAEIALEVSFQNPKVLKDGQDCQVCIIKGFANGVLIFEVPGFSIYEVVEGVLPPIIIPPTGGGGGSTGGGWTGTFALTAGGNGAPVLCTPGQIFNTTTGQRCTTTSGSPQVQYTFTRNLTIGARGEDVKQLQIFLNANGFAIASAGAGSPGSETTTFGPATRSALARYQASKGIAPAAGYFGPTTRARVNGASVIPSGASAPTSISSGVTLKLGAFGPAVKTLRTKLRNLGYFAAYGSSPDVPASASAETSTFGATTESALKKFQCDKSIICTGSPSTTGWGATGPRTRASLGI
jgi:hypothetical protein